MRFPDFFMLLLIFLYFGKLSFFQDVAACLNAIE